MSTPKILFFVFLLGIAPYCMKAQFRIFTNGIPSLSALNDSTYQGTFNFWSDQTGNGYAAFNSVTDTMFVFSSLEQLYRVDSVLSTTFTQAVLRIVEYGGTDGSPGGNQLVVYETGGKLGIPATGQSSTGATPQMVGAIINYNKNVADEGTGGVVGPGSATDNAVARFDATTGKVIQNSAVTIDDSGNVATSGTVDGRDVSADGALTDEHSDTLLSHNIRISDLENTTGDSAVDTAYVQSKIVEQKGLSAGGALVLLITGQSNSDGRGLNSAATTAELAVQNRVKIYNTSSNMWEQLDIGTNDNNQAGLGTYHGIELGLANAVRGGRLNAFDTVYIIKYAVGATAIAEHLPEGSVYETFYNDYVIEGINALVSEGKRPFVSLNYFQGEKDAGDNALTDAFPKKFKSLIELWRDNLGDGLSFSVSEILEGTGYTAASGYYNDTLINNVFRNYAARDNRLTVTVLNSGGLSTDDNLHLNYIGLKDLADLWIDNILRSPLYEVKELIPFGFLEPRERILTYAATDTINWEKSPLGIRKQEIGVFSDSLTLVLKNPADPGQYKIHLLKPPGSPYDSIQLSFSTIVYDLSDDAVTTVNVKESSVLDLYYNGQKYYIDGIPVFVDTTFTPIKISGLKLWLQPDDESTLSLVGSRVDAIQDKSFQHNDFVRDAGMPMLLVDSLNLRNAIQFDGNASLGCISAKSTWSFLHQDSAEVFVVMRVDDKNRNNPVLANGGYTSINSGFSLHTRGDGSFDRALRMFITRGVSGNNAILSVDGLAPQGEFIIADSRTNAQAIAANRVFFQVNEGSPTGGNILSDAASTSAPTYALQLGHRGDSAAGNGGKVTIAEVIVVEGIMSTEDRTNLWLYLNDRYSIY